MSFTQLLCVSQSFKGLSNQPSPYRMSAANMLPKFAPARRPIELAPRTLFEGRTAPVPAPGFAPSMQPALAVAPMKAAPAPVASASTIPELWDNLKVKCNDLHDSDLEIVVAGGARSSPVARGQAPPRSGAAVVLVWHRFRQRLGAAARSWR